jgi:hypothetical protein
MSDAINSSNSLTSVNNAISNGLGVLEKNYIGVRKLKDSDSPGGVGAIGEHVSVNPGDLTAAMNEITLQMRSTGTSVNFKVDSTSNSVTVIVKNPETGEMIRSIPPETLIRVASQFDRLRGLFFDQLR